MDQGNQLAHHPAFATPKDCYDPSNHGNWTSYKFQSVEQWSTQSGTPPPSRNWAWQVLPRQTSVDPELHVIARPLILSTPILQRPLMLTMAAAHPSAFVAPLALATSATRTLSIAAALQTEVPVSKPTAKPLATDVISRLCLSSEVESAQVVADNTQQQHVEANSLALESST